MYDREGTNGLPLSRTRGGGGGLGQREPPPEQQRHPPDHGAGRQRQRARLREDVLQRLAQGERVGQSLLSQSGGNRSGLWRQFAGMRNSLGLWRATLFEWLIQIWKSSEAL